MAWITRNLLELSIWAEYCGRSTANAEEFFCDAVRDLNDMFRKFGGPDEESGEALEHANRFIGSVKPKHKFKAVRDAASDIGRLDEYDKNCKILSKFVHPTAMSVIARFRGAGEDGTRTQFYDLGRQLADSAVENLRKSTLSTTYHKYRGNMNEALARMPREIWPVKGLV